VVVQGNYNKSARGKNRKEERNYDYKKEGAKMKKIIMGLLVVMILGLTSYVIFAKNTEPIQKESVKIINYPNFVKAGGSADIEIAWDEIPVDKRYKLRVQLENWDVSPGICNMKDITEFTTKGTAAVSLKVPSDIRATKGLRFVVAFISNTQEWKDVLCRTNTKKDVTLKGLLEVSSYPKAIIQGEAAKVEVKLENLPKDLSTNYKLLVQLENWDVSPGIVVTEEVDSFESNGTIVVSLDVPADLTADPVSGCRFVAAFVSRAKGWDDVFYMVATDKDVAIK